LTFSGASRYSGVNSESARGMSTTFPFAEDSPARSVKATVPERPVCALLKLPRQTPTSGWTSKSLELISVPGGVDAQAKANADPANAVNSLARRIAISGWDSLQLRLATYRAMIKLDPR
jgi:hypothetical protein